jgi:hypothetical protein
MRLPVMPAQLLAQRRAALLGALLGRNTERGQDWKVAVGAALGGYPITVQANDPTPYHTHIGVPYNDDGGFLLGLATALAQERLPANQIPSFSYSDAFVVGVSLVGDDI